MRQLDFGQMAPPDDACFVDATGRKVQDWPCPSQPAVQSQWIDAVAREKQGPVELLGFGFRGSGDFFASICFCPACHYGYGAAGGILQQIALERSAADHPSIRLMLMWRRNVQYGLLVQMKEVASVPLWLRTAADPRFTGDCSSLLFEEARGLVSACTVVGDASTFQSLAMPIPVYRVEGTRYERIHPLTLPVL